MELPELQSESDLSDSDAPDEAEAEVNERREVIALEVMAEPESEEGGEQS